MIEILRAEEFHVRQIMEIESACFAQPWTEGGFLSEAFSEDSFFAVAVEDSRVLGYLVLHRFSDEGELYKIAVAPSSRRRGIADMLMASAVQYTLENDINSIYLEVRESNVPAIRLYEKYGFFSIALRKNYYDKPQENAVIMVRSMYGVTAINK